MNSFAEKTNRKISLFKLNYVFLSLGAKEFIFVLINKNVNKITMELNYNFQRIKIFVEISCVNVLIIYFINIRSLNNIIIEKQLLVNNYKN